MKATSSFFPEAKPKPISMLFATSAVTLAVATGSYSYPARGTGTNEYKQIQPAKPLARRGSEASSKSIPADTEFDSGQSAIADTISADGGEFADIDDVESYDANVVSVEKTLLLGEIRKLSRLKDGWDGPDSKGTSSDALEDALMVINIWPTEPAMLPLPEVDVDVEGHVVLDIYDKSGFAIAGFDFPGVNHKAFFSVVDRAKVLLSGEIDTSSSTEIIAALRAISKVASEI